MYKFRIENKHVPVKVNSGLSLYSACKKTVGINGGIVVAEGKLIAFYCSYYKLVLPAFGANEYENKQIRGFSL
jgi:hypothetical protein